MRAVNRSPAESDGPDAVDPGTEHADRLGPALHALRHLDVATAVRRLADALATDSLLRGSLAIMATTLATSGLGYIFWVIAAHMFSTSQVGLVSALISVVTVVSILANLGLGQNLVAQLPSSPDDEAWTRALNAALITATAAGGVVGLLVVIGLPFFVSGFHELRSLPMGVMFVVGSAVWTGSLPLDYAFIAERATSGLFVRNTALSLARFVFLVAALLVGASSSGGLFASWTLAAVVAMLLGVFGLLRRMRPSYRLRRDGTLTELRTMTRALIGHHLTTIGFVLPTWLLPVIVVARLSAQDNAYFFLTWLVGGVFFMVSPSVAAALFAEGSHDRDSIEHQARRSAVIIAALLAGPMVVMVLAGRLVLGVFGAAYASRGYALLVVLVISAIPDAVTNIAVAMMRVEGRFARSASLSISMSVTTVVLAWFLLPHLGIVGAGVAWLVSQSAGTVYLFSDFARRRRSLRPAVLASV
jgi:O-antigen/teichoic acid export membrane protein